MASTPPRSSLTISRRGFVAGVAAVGVLAACGSDGSGDDASSTAEPAGSGRPATAPEATLAPGSYILAQRFPQDVQEPGLQRLPVSLAEQGGSLIQDGPDVLGAEVTDIDGESLGITSSTPRRDMASGAYYSFRVPIETPGVYYLVVEGGPEQGAAFQVMEPGTVVVPVPGSAMPPFETPTVADARGVDPICTRQPDPCPFHDVSLTEALSDERAVVYLIGTPAFCQTGTCAPGLESMIAAQERFGDSFTFVHAEVFTDNTATVPTDAVAAANLSYEPALFVVGADGNVIERLDAVWDDTELFEVLERASS